MSYIQLISPNLSAVGRPDYCLAYVETVFGAPFGEPTAWVAWGNTKFKHEDRNLPNVAVPVWCAWSGTVEGVYDNYGHVAVWTGSEVYTNPLSGSGHTVFPSVEAMEAAYGVRFVGWSEDISTVQVVKGDNMTRDQLSLLHWLAMFKPPGELWLNDYEGKSYDEAANSLRNDTPYTNPYRAETEAQYNAGAEAPALQAKVGELTAANLKLTDQLKAQPAVPVDPNSVTVTQTGLWAAFKKFLGL